MFVFVGVVFLCLAVGSIWLAVRRPDPFTIFAATLGLFSAGYYALPLLLPDMAGLRVVSEHDIDLVALMCILYLGCVLSGLGVVARSAGRLPVMRFPRLDQVATRHWWVVTIIAAGGYATYLQTADITSYSAEDFSAFFEDRSPFFAIIGFFSSFALAILALNFALAITERRAVRIAASLAIFAFIELRLLSGAQRLLFITPLFMIFVSLAGLRQFRVAASALTIGVLALLVVSPFAVALREARGGGDSSIQTAKVSYSGGYFSTTLQSIVDRSDLIYNMTFLKPYVDEHGYVGPTFYESVLVIPVPRALIPDKPYELSDTGKPDGEASILAWHIIVGDTLGSLTAFGPIIAYREGGWLAVIIDGVAAGALFAFCLGVTARSGYWGRVFLPMAFVSFAVAKVPTSFFEALAQVLTYLPILLGLGFAEALLALIMPSPAAASRGRSLALTRAT